MPWNGACAGWHGTPPVAEVRYDEDHRRECEARSWIKQGYYYPDRVDALMADIARHRGQAAANALRDEMRKQWLRRREWLDTSQASG